MHIDICSEYNDGYQAFETKKVLYKLKWKVDYILENSPDFHMEQEWLEEQRMEKAFKRMGYTE
jgi:hypothetical protein